MAGLSAAANACAITVNVFDGSRQPIAPQVDVLITLRDARQNQVYRDYTKGFSRTIGGLPYYNIGDNYTVVAWASGYQQAGFTPVRVSPAAPAPLDVMLLGSNATFNFSQARWDLLQTSRPEMARLLAAGLDDDAAARDRYTQLMEDRPAVLACFFNLATAMSQINLPSGTPLDYLKELIWDDTMQQDRFFAWADRNLVDQVRRAAEQGEFAPEADPAIFHTGATSSYKQVRFGEANVQLTFHEGDTRTIGGVDCVRVEPDMDYYKDLAAHALLEVLANALTGSLTDPKQVYVLRWIAGQHAGVPEFNPPYTIV
ncbi:MAG TPA: carboxypeptidase-like regulatory domain-containing protein [Bryobacteraceae bacterium]|nr:carboxypeptidase-like regulatory domain-containing protein [Bryobacteraceae bacterium]